MQHLPREVSQLSFFIPNADVVEGEHVGIHTNLFFNIIFGIEVIDIDGGVAQQSIGPHLGSFGSSRDRHRAAGKALDVENFGFHKRIDEFQIEQVDGGCQVEWTFLIAGTIVTCEGKGRVAVEAK